MAHLLSQRDLYIYFEGRPEKKKRTYHPEKLKDDAEEKLKEKKIAYGEVL
jgi:hypothetical protein